MAKIFGNIYEGANGEWYWKITAKNGNIIANGGEGYKNRGVALKMLVSILNAKSTGEEIPITVESTKSKKLKEEKTLQKQTKSK